MYAVRYHGCTCHQRYSQQNGDHSGGVPNGTTTSSNRNNSDITPLDNGSADDGSDNGDDGGDVKPQPWYFHVVASLILVVHGITFLVPQDTEEDDTDMVRTLAKWFGYDMDWVKPLTPYAQVLASAFCSQMFLNSAFFSISGSCVRI